MKLQLLAIPLAILFGTISSFGIAPIGYDETSVMISAEGAYGSGVVFHNGDYEFVWTAAHVVSGCEKIVKDIDPQTLEQKTTISYTRVRVIRYIYDGEDKIGEEFRIAEIIRYSDIDNGYDLALLRTLGKISKKSCIFASKSPIIGQEIFFVGSPAGDACFNSYIIGHVAAHGRGISGSAHYTDNPILNLDQYNLSIMGGASGGPVFDASSKEVLGLVTRVMIKQPSIAFAVPTTIILKYAKECDCMWAVDNKIPVPNEYKLKCPRTTSIK